MAVRSWTKEQSDAIFARGGNILVSAAAGSGKTAVLTQRVLERLTDPIAPTSLDRLLACTFSNDAAREMKDRIALALAKGLLEDPENRHLRRQQILLPTARIGTVHAFCLRLLRENFHLSKLDPTFAIADATEEETLKQQALDETLEEAFSKDEGGHFARLADSLGKDEQAVGDLILRLHRFLMSCPYPEEWLTEKEGYYTNPTEKGIPALYAAVFEELETDLLFAKEALEDLLEEIAELEELTKKGYEKPFILDLQFVNESLSLLQKADRDALCAKICGYAFPSLVPVRSILEEERKNCKDRRDRIKKNLVKWQKILVQSPKEVEIEFLKTAPSVLALFAAVRSFADCYGQKKKERQLVDYADLEHGALALLTTFDGQKHIPTPLAKELASQFDEVLLDEYQDINGVQEAIFAAVSHKDANRFMVGDMKQGIYRFRLADPRLLAAKKEAYTPYDGKTFPAKIVLGKNFRSRKEITDFINRIFLAVMRKNCGGLHYGDEDKLYPAAAYPAFDDPARTKFVLLPTDKEDPIQKQADFVAEEIKKLLEEGYLVKDGDEMRPCRPADFAILLRSAKNTANFFLKALAQRGISALSDTGDAFFETKEITFLLSLLQAIDNPLLDLPLAAALTGPVFGFSASDLGAVTAFDKKLQRTARPFYLRLTAYAQEGDKEDLRQRCADFLEKLTLWRRESAALTSHRMLEKICDETHFFSLISLLQGGEERLSRVRQLIALAAKREESGFLGLSGFVRLLSDWQEKGIRPETALPFTSDSGVRILSIHKSKGLEFPVVFLADIQKKYNHRDAANAALIHENLGLCLVGRIPEIRRQYPTTLHNMAAMLIRREEKSEEMRILYVALTRAKEKLYLVGSSDSILAQKDKYLAEASLFPNKRAYLAANLADYLGLMVTALADGDLTDNPLYAECLYQTPKAKAEEQAATEEHLPPADEEALATMKAQLDYVYPFAAAISAPAKRSVSQLKKEATDFFDDTLPAPPAFLEEKDKLSATKRGTAAHLVLEKADFAAARENLQTELERLTTTGILTEKERKAVDESHLAAFFGSELVAEILASDKVYKEQRMLFPLPLSLVDPTYTGEEQMILQGVADCIYRTKEGLCIVDYKTDHVTDEATLIARYQSQLQLYAYGAKALLGCDIRRLCIYSLSLDKAIDLPVV